MRTFPIISVRDLWKKTISFYYYYLVVARAAVNTAAFILQRPYTG